MSFAVVAKEIRELLPNAGILSLDARHHGDTTVKKVSSSSTADEAVELDLRLETLSRDVVYVIRQVQAQMGWKELPDLVLVGHSLGGAVVTDVAKGGELGSKVLAYAVLDVVEGSAMSALKSMDTYLSTRPTRFASVQDAIEWQYVFLNHPMWSTTDCFKHSLSNNPKQCLRPHLGTVVNSQGGEPRRC